MTFDEWATVARAWLSAFDGGGECESLLERAGCRAHCGWQTYLEQYAISPNDIEIHRMCFRERAKERASRSIPLTFMRGDATQFYWSKTLVSRENELAKSYGVSKVNEIAKLYPRESWRLEIDPVLRERDRVRFEQRRDFDQSYESFWTRNRMVLDGESQRYLTGETETFLPHDRLRAFKEASEASVVAMGFQPMPTCQVNYVAFQMQVSERLSLRWSIEDTDILFSKDFAMCKPNLHLREIACKKRISASRAEEFLDVPFHLLVDGFLESYYRCFESRHIKAVTYAYSILLKFILPHVITSAGLLR